MKCQGRRERESKFDKLSLTAKYNEMSQGAIERQKVRLMGTEIYEIPLEYIRNGSFQFFCCCCFQCTNLNYTFTF